MIPLLSVLMLTACSTGGDGDWPSLAADDLWDRMAAERNRPLPEAEETGPADDSPEKPDAATTAEGMTAPPADLSPPMNLEDCRKILAAAAGKYQAIADALGQSFAALEKAEETPGEVPAADRQRHWRTLQLYMSRLTNLRKNIHMAQSDMVQADRAGAAGLSDQDRLLIEQSRSLLERISRHLKETQNRLDQINPE